jgi:hypothetical protein
MNSIANRESSGLMAVTHWPERVMRKNAFERRAIYAAFGTGAQLKPYARQDTQRGRSMR